MKKRFAATLLIAVLFISLCSCSRQKVQFSYFDGNFSPFFTRRVEELSVVALTQESLLVKSSSSEDESSEPVYDAYMSVAEGLDYKPFTIYMSPQGQVFNQGIAIDLANYEHIVLLCGHYEGIDQRVIDEIVDMELSVGDFVMTGGEIPAMTVIDTVSRLVPGVLAAETSYENESHFNGLLEYPQYTRPAVWHEKPIPDVLISGHHAKIEQWKREQSLINTLKKRPDMLEKAELTKEDIKFLKEYK